MGINFWQGKSRASGGRLPLGSKGGGCKRMRGAGGGGGSGKWGGGACHGG